MTYQSETSITFTVGAILKISNFMKSGPCNAHESINTPWNSNIWKNGEREFHTQNKSVKISLTSIFFSIFIFQRYEMWFGVNLGERWRKCKNCEPGSINCCGRVPFPYRYPKPHIFSLGVGNKSQNSRDFRDWDLWLILKIWDLGLIFKIWDLGLKLILKFRDL